jgi:hypothetical protein
MCMDKCELHIPRMTGAQAVCRPGLHSGFFVAGVLCEYTFWMSSYLFFVSLFVVQT